MDFPPYFAAELKTAMLARESEKVTTLRLLISELKNSQIKKGSVLTEDEVTQVIRREVKKRQDAAALYSQQNQPERAAAEEAEIAILSVHLPAAVDSAVIESYVKELMQTVGSTPAVRGTLIKETMSHFGNQTDGRTVNEIIAKLLG